MNRRSGIVAVVTAAIMLLAGPVLPGVASAEPTEHGPAVSQPQAQDAVRVARIPTSNDIPDARS